MNPLRPALWSGVSLSLILISSSHSAGPSLQVLTVTPDRQVTLRISGSSTVNYAFERSTNLTHWTEFLTLPPTNQPAVVQFSAGNNPSVMFFRAREVMPVLNLSVTDTINALITSEGGSVELSRYDGMRIVLDVPAGSVREPQIISMTLITNFTGLPFAAAPFGAVRLEPEGFPLSASLQIFYPPGLDRRRVVSFHTDSDGANFRLALDRARSNHVVIPLLQFGTYGSITATTQEIAIAAQYRAVYGSPIAALNSLEENQLHAAAAPPGSRSCLVVSKISFTPPAFVSKTDAPGPFNRVRAHTSLGGRSGSNRPGNDAGTTESTVWSDRR